MNKPALFAFLVTLPVSGFAAPDFAPPVRLTDSAAKYRLSRNPSQAMDFDSSGTLHLAYWSGGFATSAAEPSFIYYRSWTPGGGWTAQQSIDNSEDGSAQHLGGRQPTLSLAPDGTVWVVWHDARHTTTAPPANNIDNLEIYGDFKTPGGSFTNGDLRITDTSAAHLGDNGYMPRVALTPGGLPRVLWYDYNADFGISDLYVKTATGPGAFDATALPRLTDLADRSPDPEPITAPDFVVLPDGSGHAVWTEGTSSPGPLFYSEVPDTITSSVVGTQLAAETGGFFDPARLVAAPNGDLWVLYTDRSGAARNVTARRRAPGDSAFGPPIALTSAASDQYAPHGAVDGDGILHVVWVDERAGQHVYYGEYDPVLDAMVAEIPITDTAAEWARPAIALDTSGAPVVVFEEDSGLSTGDLWFAIPSVQAAAHGWSNYE
ncbi:MAG: hypothetical protein RLY93_07320 [Sumerlaeia bacterium]